MKNLKILIPTIIMLSFLAGKANSDKPRRNRCHQVTCPPGYGISGPCFVDEEPPVCTACAYGTFSSHNNRKCRPCRRCDHEREMVLWKCSPRQDTVCVKFNRRLEDEEVDAVRPRILLEKPEDKHVIGDIDNTLRQEHTGRQQELDRQRTGNTTSHGNESETFNTDFDTERKNHSSTFSSKQHEGIKIQPSDIYAPNVTTSKPEQEIDELHLKPSFKQKVNGQIIDHDISLMGDIGTPGTTHSPLDIYIAVMVTVIAILLIICFIFFLKRRRERQKKEYFEHSSSNSLDVFKGYHTAEARSNAVISLDMNGKAITRVNSKSEDSNKFYLQPTNLVTCEEVQSSTARGHSGSSTSIQFLPTPCKTNKGKGTANVLQQQMTKEHLYNPDKIYDKIFEGYFDHKGGFLSHEDSDVQIRIPKGAIHVGTVQQIIVKVSLKISYFNVGLKDNQIPLTPVVECLSPGLDNFLEYITVMIPHRAVLPGKDRKSWRFLVHYNQSEDSRHGSWHVLDQLQLSKRENLVTQMNFTVDEKYVKIRTKHFTKFCCSTCGKKWPRLSIDVVAYGKYTKEEKQVKVNVYMCDTFKDAKRKVDHVEHGFDGKNVIGITTNDSKKFLKISCLGNRSKEDWEWQINESDGIMPKDQGVKMDYIARCCSDCLPPCSKFLFQPKREEQECKYFSVYFSVQECKKLERTGKMVQTRILDLGFAVKELGGPCNPWPAPNSNSDIDPFSKLLSDLSNSLDDDNHKKILDLLRGYCINEREAQNLETPNDIFRSLKNKGLISADNLDMLKNILRLIGRDVLIGTVEEYLSSQR